MTETVVTGGANPLTTTQPGLMIFGKTHYSFLRVQSTEPRALFKGATPTNEEKLVAYDSIGANSGVYETSGNTLTLRPVLAKNPNYAAGGFQNYQFQIDGITLTLTTKASDFNRRIGDKVLPANPADETRHTLTRVE